MADNKKDETLITFGEEGQTLRKDDPRTKEYVDRKKKEIEERSIFEGINLDNKREESESYDEYKDRMKLNKAFMKIYKQNGRDRCWEMFPGGFKAAADTMIESMNQKKKGQNWVATTPDGQQIPVTIKNDDDGSSS